MSLNSKKHEKLNCPKNASVSLDSFLGILSSAYGTEKLDSSIIFDKDTVNWSHISVDNLRAIPKKIDICGNTKKESLKETDKVNAATSTTNLKSCKTDSETDETLFSIRSLVNLQQIKSKPDISEDQESNHSQQAKPISRERIIETASTDLEDPKGGKMEDKIILEENVENQQSKEMPVCGFYVDDCHGNLIFDIQFVKKNTFQNEVIPMFDLGDPEIVIHISDTLKPMKASVQVLKSNLVSQILYFAEVEKEFGLETLEVFVKCNFGVFQWILQWIISEIPMCKPNLNAVNFKSILSMANHLGIDGLVKDCLDYFRQNFSDVLDVDKEADDVFDENLLFDLTKRFSNSEVEQITSDYESLRSKLFCTLIKLLADPEPCQNLGHFFSLSTMFQCGFCGKVLHINFIHDVPCRADCTQLTFDGKLVFHHECSPFWSLSMYIEDMHEELKDWRLVYWQLWGMCHFFYCEVCRVWYPMSQSEWCPYHPKQVEYFPMKNNLLYPIGTYGCCGEKTFHFEVIKPYGGCCYKNHVSKLDTIAKVEQFNIHQDFKNLINVSPPEDRGVKKFVKLVKKTDACSTSQSDSGIETFWWEGILLSPEEKKDYSLIPSQVLKILRNRPIEKKEPKAQVIPKCRTPVSFGRIVPCEVKMSDVDPREEFPSSSCQLSVVSKRSGQTLPVKKGKSSNILIGSKSKNKKKKSLSYVYQPVSSIWTDLESNKDNQDNQRDFEEIAMRKLVQILTPTDPTGSGHTGSAGSYIRLETEWWLRNCGSNIDKTSSTVVNRTFPLSWFRRLTI